MPMHNSDIADIFTEVGDLLEIKGSNPFRIRAYRTAARTIRSLSTDVSEVLGNKEGGLTDLPGIGEDLAGKIRHIAETGSLPLLEDLRNELPKELTMIMNIQGLGPRKTKVLYEKLHITSIDDLRTAAEEGKIRDLEGFGGKTEDNILDAIQKQAARPERILLLKAEESTRDIIEYMKKVKGIGEITAAGSFRRRSETVGDIDILVTCRSGTDVMEHFVSFEDVAKVISKGETRSTIILRSGLQVDLRVVQKASFGAALHYFTGSKEHNIAIRRRGQKRGLKINEYGVFKGDDRIAGKTEREVYESVELPYIEPELRENRGEIEAAEQDTLPQLIGIADIRGDLHVHTNRTDGHNTLEEMADAAAERGYQYIAITEHSKRLTVAKGLDPEALAEQNEKIDRLNGGRSDTLVLKGIEVDILDDGSLDLPDEALEQLDIVVASVHSKFNLSREKQTGRIVAALENPLIDILAHPTGRLLGKREPYDIDMERIMKTALDNNVYLEINAHPERLDLNDIHCKMARDMGLGIVISTDAHQINNYDYMRFGIGQARRGWLEKKHVLNTLTKSKLLKRLKRK